MDDMESQKFENAFKGAFAEAKVDPSENVWNNIELDLARAEGGELKRRILFFKLLAAASVTFAMCVAGIGYYTVQHNDAVNAEMLAESQRKIESLTTEQNYTSKKSDEVSNETDHSDFAASTNGSSKIVTSTSAEKRTTNNRSHSNGQLMYANYSEA